MTQPNSEPENSHFQTSTVSEDPFSSTDIAADATKRMQNPPQNRVLDGASIEENKNNSRSSGKQSRKPLVMIWGALLLAVVVGGYKSITYFTGSSNPATNFELGKVYRGPFRIVVLEKGVLRSFSNSTLINNVSGPTTILKLVPEGTEVRKPTFSKLTGTVTKIIESGGNRTITVKGDPLLFAVSPIFVHIDGVTRDFIAPFGKYTRMLIDEGDRVEVGDRLSGDVVCELDASAFEDKEKKQIITVTQTEASLLQSRKNVEIQRMQNHSDISRARLDLDLFILDLKKFEQGERLKLENEAKSEVIIAQVELKQAEENYRFYRRLAKKNLKTLTELDSKRISRDKAKIKLDLAKGKLDVLRKFTFIRNFKECKENVAEARIELRRVELSGKAALDQLRATLKAAELTYLVEQAKHEFLKRQIVFCKLVAPRDGKVVYANREGFGSEVLIEEGHGPYVRQPIIDLSDFSKMGVRVRIHESKISNIDVGMHVNIRISSSPDQLYQGEIVDVSDAPANGEWPYHDQMYYTAKVKLIGKHDGLKPNMNAELEIVTDEREEVLQIPVHALFSIGGEYAAYVFDGKKALLKRNIKIGSQNSWAVEILAGLNSGDRVVMRPRKFFSKEINQLQAEYEQKKAKEISDSIKERRQRDTKHGGNAAEPVDGEKIEVSFNSVLKFSDININ